MSVDIYAGPPNIFGETPGCIREALGYQGTVSNEGGRLTVIIPRDDVGLPLRISIEREDKLRDLPFTVEGPGGKLLTAVLPPEWTMLKVNIRGGDTLAQAFLDTAIGESDVKIVEVEEVKFLRKSE